MEIKRAFCGHYVPTVLAQPAVTPDGKPIWVCPDCEAAIPEQQEVRTDGGIETQ